MRYTFDTLVKEFVKEKTGHELRLGEIFVDHQSFSPAQHIFILTESGDVKINAVWKPEMLQDMNMLNTPEFDFQELRYIYLNDVYNVLNNRQGK